MGKARICIVPEYPLSLMTGGTLVQAVETCKALGKYVPDLRFELFNWSEVETPADCYHFIGLPNFLAGICSCVSRLQKPYLVTVLMGSPEPAGWTMAAWRRRAAAWLGRSREHQSALQNASSLIAITSKDADAIAGIFRIPSQRIRVVPVAVSDFYFKAKPDLWISQYGAEPFVLCVGAIQPRKNQLRLVRICNQLCLPLVLVGATLQGEQEYGTQVRSAMAENEKLGGRWLRCDDTLLASAYAACKVYVLLSNAETQPASVLQAMALTKPVLLANAPYAKAHPFDRLLRAEPEDEAEVKQALRKIWADPPPSVLPEEFTERNVCQLLVSIYGSAIRNSIDRAHHPREATST